MKKKLLGLLCVMAMLIAMIPTNVKAADDEVQVCAGVHYLDEEGKYCNTSILYKVASGITKGEAFAQALEELDALEHGGNYEFVEWEGLLSETEASEVLTSSLSKNIIAHYEKYDVALDATYLNEQGEKEQSTLTITVDEGTTVKDFYDAVVLENEKENRIGWVTSDDAEDTIGVMDLAYGMQAAAVYNDMVPVELYADYISKHNAFGPSSIIHYMQFYVAKDASDEEIEAAAIEYFKNTDEKEEPWDGLETIVDYQTLVERTTMTPEAEGFYYADWVTLGVTYDKVPLYLEYPDGEEEWVLVENEKTFTFPEEYEGYALTWDYSSRVNEVSELETVSGNGVKEVTIVKGMYFYHANAVQGDKLFEYVEIDEENPSISAEELEQIIASDMDVTIDTKKDVVFQFKAGTMKEVSGKTEYDFGVEVIVTPTTALLEKAPFDADEFVLRVNYNYSGELPGEAEITILVGKEYAGQTLYYYLVKDNGELEYTNTKAVVNENGEYIIKQSHCSDYVIATVAPDADDNSDGTNPGGDVIGGMGDNSVVLYAGILFLGVALIVVARKRKTV